MRDETTLGSARRHLFVEPASIHGDRVLLRGDDRHHVVRVLRLPVGTELSLADGTGAAYVARIHAIERDQLELAILEHTAPRPVRAPSLSVVAGLTRGAKIEWTLQKCTELGADEIILARCQRSVVKPNEADNKLTRWQEIVRQAARQSERLTLPAVRYCATLAEALQRARRADGVALLATPTEPCPRPSWEEALRARPPSVAIAVGPEGGFTPREEAAAREIGFTPVLLGPQILRAETAAIALLTVVAYCSGRLDEQPPLRAQEG